MSSMQGHAYDTMLSGATVPQGTWTNHVPSSSQHKDSFLSVDTTNKSSSLAEIGGKNIAIDNKRLVGVDVCVYSNMLLNG